MRTKSKTRLNNVRRRVDASLKFMVVDIKLKSENLETVV